jgi:hypothetical protein
MMILLNAAYAVSNSIFIRRMVIKAYRQEKSGNDTMSSCATVAVRRYTRVLHTGGGTIAHQMGDNRAAGYCSVVSDGVIV